MTALTFEQGAAVASVIAAMEPWRRSLVINSCIEQVRMLCDVLPAFGFVVRPLQVDLLVTFHQHEAIFAAVSEEFRGQLTRRATGPVVDSPRREGGFLGHMVVLVNECVLIDPSIGQAHVPESDPEVVLDLDVHTVRLGEPVDGEGWCIEQGLTTDAGQEVTILWRYTGRQEYLEAGAWEPEPAWVVEAIVRRARRILDEGLAARAAKTAREETA